MVYDAARERVVLFGGFDVAYRQDTWEWDGTRWVDRTPEGDMPSARHYHALAYDAARERVVLFGGSDGGGPRRDTWEWDGTDWVDRTPDGDEPSARAFHAMAYDAARARVVLFGGFVAGSRVQDLWEWDGTRWVDRTPAGDAPSGRSSHALAYDAARERLVLFGGSGGGQTTWEWDAPPARQPALQWTASVGDTGIDPAAVTGVRIRAHCGGRFSPRGDADTGAVLLGWATGGPAGVGDWLPLDTNATGIEAQAPWLSPPPAARLDATLSGDDWRRFFLERDGQLAFQCGPNGVSGTGQAQVALDYVEVRVRYRSD